jgi:hypothetical protein
MSKIVEPEILLLDDNLVVRQNQIKESPIFSTPKVNQFLENGNSQISPIEREEILKEQIKQYVNSTTSGYNGFGYIKDKVGQLALEKARLEALQKERKEALEKARLEALEKSAESFKDSETTPSIAKDNSKLINIALLGAVGFLVYKLLK